MIDSSHFDLLSDLSSTLTELEASNNTSVSKLANELRIDIATRHTRDLKQTSGMALDLYMVSDAFPQQTLEPTKLL